MMHVVSGSSGLGVVSDWPHDMLEGHQRSMLLVMIFMLIGPWLLRPFQRGAFTGIAEDLSNMITIGGGVFLCMTANDLFHHATESSLFQVALPFLIFAVLESLNGRAFLGPRHWKYVLFLNGTFTSCILANWWHEANRHQTAALGFSLDSIFIGLMVAAGYILMFYRQRA